VADQRGPAQPFPLTADLAGVLAAARQERAERAPRFLAWLFRRLAAGGSVCLKFWPVSADVERKPDATRDFGARHEPGNRLSRGADEHILGWHMERFLGWSDRRQDHYRGRPSGRI
jgi:hypothetical protein